MTLALTVALSLRNQINSALAASRSANLVAITTPQSERAVLRSSGSLPGVKSRTDTTTVSTTPAAVNGLPLASVIGPAPAQSVGDAAEERVRLLSGVTGYDLGHGSLPTQINLVEGRALGPADANTNNVIVRSGLLGPPYSLQLGDWITLKETGTGVTRTVRVVGFYSRQRGVRNFGSFFMEPVVADRSLAVALGGADAQTVVAFSVDANHLSGDATTLQRAVPGALVIDIGDLAAVVEQILNELLNVLAVITALVLGAGIAVVANGVALAMMERRREIALFKAIGFGPGNVLRFVLVENALIGTLAGAVSVLAAAIGLALLSHFALQQAIGFDPVVAVIVLLIAAALAVVTAYLTARVPVRVRPLEALRNE
jgi:predicted lysophospholipase L1 biosynthesis ABC-type transport system permease subunit